MFEIKSEIDEKILSSMINKLLQCLFKGFERLPRTFEELSRIIDEGWEKKRSDIVKGRLKNKYVFCVANPVLKEGFLLPCVVLISQILNINFILYSAMVAILNMKETHITQCSL